MPRWERGGCQPMLCAPPLLPRVGICQQLCQPPAPQPQSPRRRAACSVGPGQTRPAGPIPAHAALGDGPVRHPRGRTWAGLARFHPD